MIPTPKVTIFDETLPMKGVRTCCGEIRKRPFTLSDSVTVGALETEKLFAFSGSFNFSNKQRKILVENEQESAKKIIICLRSAL